MSIGSLSDLKTTLGIATADTTEDSLLTLLLAQVSDLAEDYMDRTFASAAYTELYAGNGTEFLILKQRPVTAVASIYLDESANYGTTSGAWDSSTLLTSGIDYSLVIDKAGSTSASSSGMVQKIGGVWPMPYSYSPGRISYLRGPADGNIKITYTAGETAPSRLSMAVYNQVAALRNSGNRGQLLANESYGDGAGSSSYGTRKEAKIGVMTAEFTSVLARLKNVAVA